MSARCMSCEARQARSVLHARATAWHARARVAGHASRALTYFSPCHRPGDTTGAGGEADNKAVLVYACMLISSIVATLHATFACPLRLTYIMCG